MTEQSGPREIVRYASAGEQAGFDFEVMSDHYSPWLVEQGHAAYAWSMLGAVAQVTDSVELMTYVTCPIMRYHPAVVAKKAATDHAADVRAGEDRLVPGRTDCPPRSCQVRWSYAPSAHPRPAEHCRRGVILGVLDLLSRGLRRRSCGEQPIQHEPAIQRTGRDNGPRVADEPLQQRAS